MAVHLRVAARTDVGRVRSHNEDAFVAADLTRGECSTLPAWTGLLELGDAGLLLAVSDGIGGAAAGEVASALVVSTLARALASSHAETGVQELIEAAVHAAHDSVWAEACARGVQMGATLTAVFLRGTRAYVAEVGDSRAYLVRAGRISLLTKDQSYVQLLVDAGAVGEKEAQALPARNMILQAMGGQPGLSIALGVLELRSLDCLLLCSDGLSTKVPEDEMRQIILASPDLPTGVGRLVDLANERGGDDNVTVILGGVSGDLPPPDTGETLERTYRVLETFAASSPHAAEMLHGRLQPGSASFAGLHAPNAVERSWLRLVSCWHESRLGGSREDVT